MSGSSETARERPGWLSRLPITSKLLLVSLVYVAIIVGLQVLGNLALDFQSSVRAFVGGEGLWSKAQKDAVHHLVTYTLLQREEDFERYRSAMAVNLGDRRARLALSREEPDLAEADAGFIEGRNHPDDVRGMSMLFVRFGWWKYLSEAIVIWQDADRTIDELVHLGDRVHDEVRSGALTRDRQVELVAEIDALNRRATVLEDRFSATLGAGARVSLAAVSFAMLLLAGLAVAAGLWLSLRISRGIGGGVLALRDGARRVAAGDFSERIAVRSADEIGELARGFNQMTDSLVAHISELEKKEQALSEMDRLKTQFFANVSHELRTPLALLLGPAGKVAADAALPTETRQAAAMIERNAQLLLKHVNDLLDLSRLDAGRMALEPAAIDVVRLTSLVASHFEVLAGERSIRFELDAPDELVAEVDRGKLERILFNLLSNAFKFTPDGAWVRVAWTAGPERATLVVEDGGPGVPAELREAIFERFRQADGDSTRRHGGTGLGLAIAHEFVDLHGGAIRVETAAGGGARFVVELPRKSAGGALPARPGAFDGDSTAELARRILVEPPRPAEPALAIRQEEAAPDGRDRRPLVLVVEDNPDMNAFLVDVLGERCRVVSAFDGEEGLARALELRPDLVVTDVMMPKMSGDQMIHAARAERALDVVPFLVLTARADEALRVRLLRDGAQDFLVKPFSPAELVSRVDNLVAIKRTRESIERRLDERTEAAGRIARVAAEQRLELLRGFERLRESESRLRMAVAEKEVLLREIHHRVKNNLQVVASLLQLHIAEGAEGPEAAAVDTLRRCGDRVRAMALLHEALYRRSDLARVDLGEYLSEVVASVEGSYATHGRIRLEVDAAQAIVVDAETALPCGLILHELVVNAVRHAFPDGRGTVRVALRRGASGRTTLLVEDDGRGLPPGLDLGRVESLGLQLVSGLAAQAGAQLELARGSDGRGTAFHLELAA